MMTSCAMHDDEQFAAACQSAVEELTAWPTAGRNSAQNRTRVLAYGLGAAFGFQECLQMLPQHQQQSCSGSMMHARSSDAHDTSNSNCAHDMSSLDSNMVCQALKEGNHGENCLQSQHWRAHPSSSTSTLERLHCNLEQAVSRRQVHEDVGEDADGKRWWEDVGVNEEHTIFVCGGRDHSWRGSTMGLLYWPARDCWSPYGAPLRDGVTFASVASLGETVFLFGNSLPPLSSIPSSETAWTPLQSAPFITGLQFAAVEAVSDKIFVAGGRSLPNKVRSTG
jgi:hypothetical protein